MPSELCAYWNIHYFNSFFYTKICNQGHQGVARWTRRVDVFSKNKLLFPINLGNSHWVTGCINVRHRRIEYYDSMHAPNPAFFRRMRSWLKAEHRAKRGTPFCLGAARWEDHVDPSFPLQTNGYDCGVFTMAAMGVLSRRNPTKPFPSPLIRNNCEPDANLPTRDAEALFDFTGKDMPYLRRRFAYELISKRLMDSLV